MAIKSKKPDLKSQILHLPLHPLFLAIFPILFFYSNNIEEVFLTVLPKPLFVSIALTFFSLVIIYVLLKNTFKSSFIVSFFLILFFSFGHVKTFANLDGQLLLGIWILIFAISTYLLSKTKKNLSQLNNFLNIASVLLVSFSLINIIYFEVSTNRVARLFESKEKSTAVSEIKLTKPENPPDIYYLIFDRYASFNTTEKKYNHDLGEFKEFLTSKGFFVAEQSHANYPRTFLSLGSSLNMEYVTYLSDKIGEDSSDESSAYYLLNNHKVGQLLKSQGYKYIHVGSWWEPTRMNENADKNYFYSPLKFKGLGLDEFSTKFVGTTLLAQFLTKNSKGGGSQPLYGRDNHREGILFQFETLNNIAKEKNGPKFVFAHLLAPHFPYVLDKDCNNVVEKEAKSKSNKENYLNQLDCTNKKIQEVVDNIFSASGGSAIIILQADEGPDPIKGNLEKQWQKSDINSLKEKTSILNAIYLPSKNKRGLYPEISPVNTFRIIFNLYFGANFDILEDKTYVIENKERPYKLYDITEKLR